MDQSCPNDIRKIVEEIISKNKVVFVTIIGCPPCLRLRNHLEMNLVNYYHLDVSGKAKDGYYHCIYEKTKNDLFPQLIHNGKHIGGYYESIDYMNKGNLRDSYKKFINNKFID
jgi:glutaredoxin